MIKLKVDGMHCGNCEQKIIRKLISSGIVAKVDMEQKTVEVANKDQVLATKLITELGYKVIND